MPTHIKQQRAFIPLFLIIFIDSMGYGLIIPVLLRLISQTEHEFFSSTFSEAMRNFIYGLGVAISPLAYLLFAPIVGSWSDKWGRKKTMLICLCCSCIGFILPVIGVIYGSLTLILLGRVLSGGASSSQPIAQAAVSDISSGKQKAFYLAMIAFAMTLAMVAGPLLGSYLSDPTILPLFNNTTPFLAAAILVFINIILMWMFFNETYQQKATGALLNLPETISALTLIFTQQKTRILLLVFFIYEFSWSLYFQAISLFLTQRFHYDINKTALFIAYIGIWMSLGLLVLYCFVIRYISLNKCLLYCLSISTLSFIGCLWDSHAYLQWIFIVPAAIAIGMAYPTILALMSDRIGKTQQGWVMGAAASMLALSWMLSAIMSGMLTNIYLILPLQVAALTMLLSVIIFIISIRSIKQPV